jgi:hypothetical protein
LPKNFSKELIMKKVLAIAFIAVSSMSSVAPANAQVVSRYQNFSGCRNTALGNNTWGYTNISRESRAAQAESKKSGGVWSTLGEIAGGAIGTAIGGPPGTALGTTIGGGLGELAGGGGEGGGSPATSSERIQNNTASKVQVGMDCTKQKEWDSRVKINGQNNATQRLNIRESNATQRLNIRESNTTQRYGIDATVKINDTNNATQRYGIDATIKINDTNNATTRYGIDAQERMNKDNNGTAVEINRQNTGVQMRAIDVQERHQNQLRINSAANNALGWQN